ncbi:MAG: tripartite tricarboxylate transporter TctB family protein [Deltaproteobacteria bacterium]|nr:tripartite tricarboxylate transporter TctB family protein [Deltaproteobacteria bacterium]
MSRDTAKRKNWKFGWEHFALVLFIVLGGAVMTQSTRLSLGNLHNPGPGFMPFLLGIAMVLLSGRSYLEISPIAAGEKMNDGQEKKPILLIFGGLILYLALMDLLGFYVSTFLLLIYLMRTCGEKQYWRSLWISGITVIVVYVVFYKLFIIPFPEGLLGI